LRRNEAHASGDRGIGYDGHPRVRVAADEREQLEHLARYVCRPALASERLSIDGRGRVRLELRHPWRDGTTHVLFEPLVFLERLAALVPHPREHQLTYHGVLAPASSWRDRVVPPVRDGSDAAESSSSAAFVPSDPDSALDLFAAACPDVPPAAPAASAPCTGHSPRYSWAELLRRVFEIDVLTCPTCGSRRRLVALISDPPVVRKILRHLGLPAEPPVLAPPRSPPQMVFGF
jgi:hypothetical protein